MFSSFVQKLKYILNHEDNGLIFDDKSVLKSSAGNSFEPILSEEVIRKNEEMKYFVYDCLRTIRDPEKPATLEDLNVVYEDGIQVSRGTNNNIFIMVVEFKPTISHCNLATLIGLCIRTKIQRCMTERFKLDIFVQKGSHDQENEVNKQINDKERVAAAMENPALQGIVENCIKEEE